MPRRFSPASWPSSPCAGPPGGSSVRHAIPFAVIAYYGGRGRGVEGLPVGKLTHVIYSFLHLKGDSLAVDGPRDSSAIASLVSLKKGTLTLR